MSVYGVVYAAFGKTYDQYCINSAKSVRAVCNFPITVLTNMNESCEEWQAITGVQFVRFTEADDQNRLFKIRSYWHSSFDVTRWLDADTLVVAGDEFVKSFDVAKDFDFMAQRHMVAEGNPGGPYAKTDVSFPLQVYHGGAFWYSRTAQAAKLFETWLHYYLELGGGRDMPSLAIAVQKCKSALKLSEVDEAYEGPQGRVVLHASGLRPVQGIPKLAKFKPLSDNTWAMKDIKPAIKKQKAGNCI